MSTDPKPPAPEPAAPAPHRPKLSLDWWAVLASLALVALVRSGAIRSVPW